MRNYSKKLNLTRLDILNITVSLETFKSLRKQELEKTFDYESRQILKDAINDVEKTLSKFDEIITEILDEPLRRKTNKLVSIRSFVFSRLFTKGLAIIEENGKKFIKENS